MANHYLGFASYGSGEDIASLNDAAITTGTSTNASAVIELRWSDAATGSSSYVLRRRDLIDALKRLIVFVDSNGAYATGSSAGTDLPVN